MKQRYNINTGLTKIKTKTTLVFSALALGFGGVVMAAVIPLSANAAGGFDQYGYNRSARVFNGTCTGWYNGKYGGTLADAQASCGAYSSDKLVMKWNKAWDDCNTAGNADPNACSGATLTNEWNGMAPGGSGETEHFKAVWITPNSCGADYTVLADGGYCIWGHYEATMDQGMADGSHWVLAHATPNGFGVSR
jgi:hypothetical protein